MSEQGKPGQRGRLPANQPTILGAPLIAGRSERSECVSFRRREEKPCSEIK